MGALAAPLGKPSDPDTAARTTRAVLGAPLATTASADAALGRRCPWLHQQPMPPLATTAIAAARGFRKQRSELETYLIPYGHTRGLPGASGGLRTSPRAYQGLPGFAAAPWAIGASWGLLRPSWVSLNIFQRFLALPGAP